MRVIDITRPLEGAVPWPGERGLERALTKTHARDGWETSELHLCSHLGTHVDAPAHLFPDGKRLGRLTLDPFVGPALVVDCGDARVVGPEALPIEKIKTGDRILLKTANSARRGGGFFEDFCYPGGDAVRLLVERGISLLGVDGPSVDGFEKEPVVHRLLFERDIPALEGLDLSDVAPGRYTLVCLPLKIEEAEGAPCRAVLLEG
ncbi:MAG TPA: cyclase family protein [bacterium]|nr:cyclase family protein [bacterium]